MASWTLIAAATLVAAPWKNGFGTSRDIASGLGWTVSIADLERDAPFSHYPDAERVFTPIAGDPPPLLAFSGGPFEPCPLLTPKRFPGDVPTLSRIPAPGRAFNVIVNRTRLGAEVTVAHLVADEPVRAPSAPVTLLHCLTGHLTAPGALATPGDSLLALNGGEAAKAGENSTAIIVTIRPRA